MKAVLSADLGFATVSVEKARPQNLSQRDEVVLLLDAGKLKGGGIAGWPSYILVWRKVLMPLLNGQSKGIGKKGREGGSGKEEEEGERGEERRRRKRKGRKKSRRRRRRRRRKRDEEQEKRKNKRRRRRKEEDSCSIN